MCKHILFSNFNKSTDLETLAVFSDMTHENDGYGAIIRTKSGKIKTLKSLNQGSFYLKLSSAISANDVESLVVHHRTSTNGDGIEYAHPFDFLGHYMTHNGVVSVPGKHDTRTTNDSEALLHHLVKTGYDTESIRGYFSCFILTSELTRVLVDDTAPIYSDGRVYCSHKLGKNFSRIALSNLTLDRNGNTRTQPIVVTKTDYGREKVGLSLGGGYTDTIPDDFYSPDNLYALDRVEDFFYYSSDEALDELAECSDSVGFYDRLFDHCERMGLKLTHNDAEHIRAFLS
jgi:hypothetical protein